MSNGGEYRYWTTAENARLTTYLGEGLTLRECAERLGKSYSAVQQHLMDNKHLRPVQAKARTAWSPEEDAAILGAFQGGMRPIDVAAKYAQELGRPRKGVLDRLHRLRFGRATQWREPKIHGQRPQTTYLDLARRHCATPPKPQSEQDDHAVRRAALQAKRQRAAERGDLYAIWCRRNDAVAARNAAMAAQARGESC